MKKVRLNESDIENLVNKVIKEDDAPKVILTGWEEEYITEHLPGKIDSEFYWDNPSAAIEDVEWLLKLVNRLK